MKPGNKVRRKDEPEDTIGKVYKLTEIRTKDFPTPHGAIKAGCTIEWVDMEKLENAEVEAV